MVQPSAAIVGRETEMTVVGNFVAEVDGPSASMVIDGVVGIGKTMLWNHGIGLAVDRGIAVRACRCTEADAAWAFSGLGDLFDGLPSAVLERLPDVQRSALAAALLISRPSPNVPTDRLVGVAVLSVLRLLADDVPQLLAIDDVQWLDSASPRRVDVRVAASQRRADSCIGNATNVGERSRWTRSFVPRTGRHRGARRCGQCSGTPANRQREHLVHDLATNCRSAPSRNRRQPDARVGDVERLVPAWIRTRTQRAAPHPSRHSCPGGRAHRWVVCAGTRCRRAVLGADPSFGRHGRQARRRSFFVAS